MYAIRSYYDNQNLTWIGSWFGGLNITNERKNSIKIHTYHGGAANTLSHNVIHTIFEDKQHKIWLGNGKGTLDKLDPTTKTFTRYKDPGMITSEPVSSIINGYRITSYNVCYTKLLRNTTSTNNYSRC